MDFIPLKTYKQTAAAAAPSPLLKHIDRFIVKKSVQKFNQPQRFGRTFKQADLNTSKF